MIAYYVEVNLVCIVILLLFAKQLKNMETTSTDQGVLSSMIWVTVLLCFCDLIAGVLRGRKFFLARTLIESSNLLYFESMVVISFLWNTYVDIRLIKRGRYDRRKLILNAIPLILFTCVAVANPFLHFLFQINSENLYERNDGIILHWIVVWAYFLFPSIRALVAYIKEPVRLRKHEIAPMLYFMIAPFISSMIQMLFYGITSTQVGITISIVMICLATQDTQILTDALTGINNRRGFDYFLANSIQHNPDAIYTLVMIDVDRFKFINDKYGHMTGDLVLQSIAEALKQACKAVSRRLQLSRFGGDEFMILGVDCAEEEITVLRKAIQTEMDKMNAKSSTIPHDVQLSIGIAIGNCSGESELRVLMSQADQAMYEEKNRKKVQR